MTKYLLNNTRNTTGNSSAVLDNRKGFFKSIILSICIFVGISGGAWGQTFSIVGSGTSGSGFSYANPYNNGYYGNKTQQFVTAAQLTASGIAANSTISQLGFKVTTAGTGAAANLSGFTIKVYTTASTNPLTAWVTSSQVAQSTPVTLNVGTTGWKMTTLQSSFVWNGTSNLVIETCYNNNTYVSGCNVEWTTTGLGTGTWSRWYRADASTVCSSTLVSGTSTTSRPNIRFAWSASSPCSGTPAPGNTLTSSASAAPGSTVNLSLSTPPTGSGLTYQWESSTTSSSSGFTSISGATSATYTATVSATTWYRCIVTCSGATGTSAAVQVSLAYCTPSSSSVDGSGITNVSFGTSPNVNNTTTTETNNYGNYSAQIGGFTQGTNASVSITFNTYDGWASYDYATIVFVDWNNDLDFADAGETVWTGVSAAASPAVVTATFTVSSLQALGNYRMRIGAGDVAAPGACTTNTTYTCFEDYTLTVTASVACSGTPTPGNTVTSSASVSSGSTVNLSLSTPPTGTGLTYQWESSTTSSSSGFTSISGATSATYTATVSATTWYRCLVTCSGATGTSTAVQVTLTACIPVTTNGCTDGDVIARVMLNTLDNNSGTGCPSGTAGYSNYTSNSSLTTTLLPSSTYNCTVYAGQYPEGYAAWIDYNDDLVFDNSTERIGYSNGQVAGSGSVGVLGSSAVFPITLACTPPAGNHLLRVRAMYNTNGINVTPCTANSYGETEDYMVTISAAPACASPGLVTSITPSTTSASLTWATNCSAATNYDFQYGPTGFTLGTGTILTNQAVTVSAPNASFNLTGLTQNTTYQVYYRANCGGGVTSAWSVASSITTLCAPSGDEVTAGVGSWIGYVYNSASAGAFTSYKGFVTEAETFNTLHTTTPNGATIVTCPANSDLFAIRYKMTKTFASGNYVFTVGGDDGVRLSIDGGATWLINGWLDQGYTSYSSSSVALSGAVNLVFEFYENSSGAQSSFSYAAAPIISSLSSNAICPNATITIAGSNFTGITDVSFNGVAATSYTVVSSTSITAVAPASVTSGSVTVTNSISTATSSSYTVNTFPTTPTAAVSGSSTINVGGTTTLTSTAANTIWYTVATGGSSIGTGTPFTSPVQCTPGTITYYAEDNNGTCASNARGAVSFTVRPMIGSNPSNALICSSGGSVTLSAQLTGGSSITWSPNTNLSTSTGSPTVASPTATTVYTMSATVTGCGAVSTTQAVGVIDAVAFTPTATPTAVCAGNTAALASNLASSGFTVTPVTCALSTVPGSGVTTLCAGGSSVVAPTSTAGVYTLDDSGWGNVPLGFTYNFFGTNYTSLNVGTNGVVQFGAYNAGALADFIYTSLPNAAEPLNIIALAANDNNLSATGAASSIQYWTEGIAPTRVFVLYYNQAVQYATGPGFTTGQIKLFETTGNVETHITTSTSTNNKVVGLQNFDASIGAMPLSTTAAITNLAWKFIPGANYTFQWATAGANIGSATGTTYTTANLSTPGTVTYNVAATNPNTQCTTTQSVNITVNALPSAPVSAGDVTACNTTGSQNLVVSTGSGETADWYAASTGGSILASGDNVLAYSTATAATYYAEAQNTTTGCVSATRTGVTLNVNTSPAAPTAPAATYCQGETATALTASTPSGSNTQSWYTVPSGGTPLSGAPTPSTASTGTTTYYVSETSGSNGCESARTSVSVTVNATPSAPVASNPAAYCQNATASALTATATTGNTLYWYTVPTGGTGSSTAPTPSTATAGTTNYYVADRADASGCEGSRTTITVTVTPTITASVSNSASSSSVCGGGAITFTATPTNGGTPTYQWYLNGNPVGSNSATYTMNVASDNASNYSGSWTNGSNLGSGLNAWSITNNSNTGYFLGNPSNDGNGTANIGTTAHGIWATSNHYINASRGLTNPMQIGDELRFYWVFNWDANLSGNKGFDIKSGGTNIFNVNNSSSPSITAGSNVADAAYGTTPMYVSITRTSATLYTFTMTRRSDGTTFSTTFSSSLALDEISFYIGGQNDGAGQRNLYFNGIELRPASNNDAIYVEITPSSQACLASTAATASNTVTLSSSPATPTAAIQSSASSAFCPGTSVTFSVNSSANMGSSPTYQWNLNGSPISNETNSTLVLTSLANNDQVTLTMTSSLSAGCLTQSSATSAAITSVVNNGTTISSQPIAVSSCLGGTQSFSVSVAGTGTLTYQWKKNGTNISGNSTANTATLTLAGIGSGDVDNYTVDVTGTCGTVTSSAAALSLNAATAISVQPSAVTACTATNAIYSVTATGYGTVTYQWRKDGTPISGATSSSYTAAGVTSSNVGNYSVVVSGGCGNVTSIDAALAVQPATVISSQPNASTICQNNSANFSVTASGQGTLTYQWQLNGASISGETSSGLSVSNAQASNAGSITVVVTGACGSTTSNAATFTVNPNTSISTQPVGSTAGCNIQNYTFSVVAAGTSLSYQWNFASANVGNNSASYTISNATTANDGNYYVTVSGACGNPVNSNTVALSVNASPTANAGADITGASTCGKNTIPLGASTLSSGTTGLWSLVSGTNQPLFGLSGTSETSDITGSYGGTYTLAWTVTNTATNCTNTDNMVVTFNQPITTSLGNIGVGDLLWNGLTSNDWSTASNWYALNSAGLCQLQTGTIEPTAAHQVFTLTTAQGGVCIGSNMPTIGNGDNALDVFVGSGITLNLASGSLNLSGNLVNNGTINAAQGTINFIGSTNATISGSGTTTLNNVTINKSSSANLTLSTNVAVNGVLNMTQGNVFTAASPNGLLTLGSSSAVPGTLTWTSGNIVGPFRRFFTTAATQGNEGLFPVGTATYQRYAKVNFATSPGTNQTLTAWYKTGTPMSAGAALYNGLPLTTQDGQLIQNYSADGYWQIDPTDNNYTAPINSANYSIDLYANNLTGMQDPTICRIIKAAGSNTSSSNHVQWQGCGTHTTIPTGTSASAFVINSTVASGFSWFGAGTSNNQALPVELTSFSGNCADGKVDLEWSTATEHNSAYFQVEYSRDGSVWQNIGVVAAAGNSVQNINYTLTHEQVASGNNYYRLRQVDIDGVEELYDAIAVTCTAGSDQYIMTYPNPSEQNFQVALLDENLIGTATLSMVDARGMLIHSELLEVKAGTNLFLFNNTGLAPGIYYVKISKGAYSSEVVKQVVR